MGLVSFVKMENIYLVELVLIVLIVVNNVLIRVIVQDVPCIMRLILLMVNVWLVLKNNVIDVAVVILINAQTASLDF